MHILYVVTRGDVIGGASMHVLQLAVAMQQKGLKVTLILGSAGVIADMARQQSIPVIIEPSLVRQLSPLNDVCCIFRFYRLFKRLKPDLIHVHSAKAALIGRIAAALCHIPAVMTVHGWPFAASKGISKWLYQRIEKVMLRFTSRVILVSEKDFQLAQQQLGLHQSAAKIIHNGISEVTSAKSYLAEGDADICHIICVARFEAQKDHHTLILAVAGLGNTSWDLTLVGDGPTLADMKRLVVEYGIQQHVHFLGERKDVAALLEKSDVFVLASHWESLPISVIEAMRAKLAIVATDVGGMAELITDQHSGFLIKAKDVAGMTLRLQQLIHEKALRQRLGQNAYQGFLQHFTAEHMLQQTLQCYQLALGIRP